MPTSNEAIKPAAPRTALLTVLVFALAVGLLWAFPQFWYRGDTKDAQFVWLAEQTNVSGWDFKNLPIPKSDEELLAGDRSVNGEFSSGDAARLIRVFSIKRYLAKDNEVGLFFHSPDRCWTGIGWKIQLIEPQVVECQIHGLAMRFERRLFVHDGMKELVYFGALIGGKALPYRLNQHLAANLERPEMSKTNRKMKDVLLGYLSRRIWGWTWDSFVHRTALGGPQQFIRISTPVGSPVVFLRSAAPTHEELRQADERLQDFLPRWLVPVDYTQEFNEWKASKTQAAQGTTASPPKVH